MDVGTVAKMTASSFIKEEREDDSTCYGAIGSEAKMKADQNNPCTRETFIKESYGLSLGREFGFDHNTEAYINQATQFKVNNRISNTLCSMIMRRPNNGENERNAVYHTNADINEKRIGSQKTYSRGNNGIRKERTNKIIIANVPCNQDWINLNSYENTAMFFDESMREDDEIMVISASGVNKQCIPRRKNKFSKESELNQSDKEVEILDTVDKYADISLDSQDCVFVEEVVDATEEVICLESNSRVVPKKSRDNFLPEAQGSVTGICHEIPQKLLNEIASDIFNPKVKEACNTKKCFEFHENASVDKSHEIHETTPVEDFDKAHESVVIKKEIPDYYLLRISESTSDEEYINVTDEIREIDKAPETVVIKKEFPDDYLMSIAESTSNEEYINVTDEIQEFDKAPETVVVKKEIPDDHLINISESTPNEEYTYATDEIQLKIESVYHLDEWEGEEIVFESNLNKPAENDNVQRGDFFMPTIKKEKGEPVRPNNMKICENKQDINSYNMKICENKQDINSSEVNCKSSNLVKMSSLPKSKPLENSSGDYTYVKKLSGLRPYKCSQCLFACKNKESLILHMQKCFRRRQRRDRTRKKYEGKKKSMKCFLCSSQLENNFKLIQHLFRVHADTVNSNSVRSEIMSMIEVSEVNGSTNNSRNKIIENALRNKVGNSSNVSVKVGNSSKMPDQIPGTDVKKLLYFRDASKNTQSSTEPKCIFCGKHFYHNLEEQHVRKCIKRICSKEGYILVNDKKKTCEEQKVDNKEKLRSETYKGGKFGCLICMKFFKRLRRFYEHLFSHTLFKPYECPFCKKYFLKRRLRSCHIQEKCKKRLLKPKRNIDKYCKIGFGNFKPRKNFHVTNLDIKFNQGETLENHPVSAGERINNRSVCCTNYNSTTNDCSRCNDGKIDQPFQSDVAVFQRSGDEGLDNCSTAGQVDEDSLQSFPNSDDSTLKEKGEPVFCSVCSKLFENQADLENHWSYAHEQLRCLYCRTVFKDKINLKYHTRNCRVNSYSDVGKSGLPDRNPENNVEKNTNNIMKRKHKVRFNIPSDDTSNYINSSGSYNCSDCGRSFRSYYNLFSHRLVVHENTQNTDRENFRKKSSRRHFICITCGKLFLNKVMLRFHVKDCLLSEKMKNRRRTKSRRETFHALRRDDKLHDFVGFTKPYICLFCKMEFSDEFCFKLHKSKHCTNPKVGKPKGTYDLIVRLERIDDNILPSEI